MLHLILQLAGARYALEARAVIEVLPLVRVQPLAPAVTGVAGVIDHRGAVVPLVDLGLRFAGTPTLPRLGARIIVVSAPETMDAQRAPAALLVERVLGTTQLKPEALLPHSGAGEDGRFMKDALGFIQVLDLSACLARPGGTSASNPDPEPCAPSKSF